MKIPLGAHSERPYSAGLIAGPFVFVSGQVGIDPASGAIAGRDIGSQTAQVLRNLEAVLAQADLTLDDVVKTTVFLTDMSDFGAMNEVYRSRFGRPMPTRSTVQVSGLARPEMKIEIEAIALRGEGDK